MNKVFYKVVDKETRYGSNMCIYKSEFQYNIDEFIKTLNDSQKKWFPKYLQNSIIKAPKESQNGIFIFSNIRECQVFAYNHEISYCSVFLKVQPLCKIEKLNNFVFSAGYDPTHLFDISYYGVSNNNNDCITCRKIKVLE